MTRTPQNSHSHFDSPPPWGDTSSPKNATNPLMTRGQDVHKAKAWETQHFFNPAFVKGGFNPGDLFDPDKDTGVFYDFSTGVYQENTFTTPAGVGDPVGGIRDQSGSGNDLIQAAADNRPILVEQDGKLGLQFDGVSDFMTTAGNSTIIGRQITAAFGFVVTIHASTSSVMAVNNATQPRWRFGVGGLNAMQYQADLGLGTKTITGTGTPQLDTPSIQMMKIDADTLLFEGFWNNVSKGTNGLDLGAGNFPAVPIYLGSRFSNSQFLNGRVYGGVFAIDRVLGKEEQDQLAQWLADRTPGVKLP